MDLRGFLRFCAENGLEGVDLLDSVGYPWLWRDAASELAQVARWAEAEGVAIVAHACGNNFAKAEESAFRAEVATVENAIEEAARCGAPLLRVFGGYHLQTGGELGYARGMERVREGLEACLPLAQARGVVLALENHGRLPGHSYEIAALLAHFDTPWLKVTFDPANFLANNMDEPEDPLRAYERLHPQIAHVHVKDFGPAKLDLSRRVEPCLPGEGLTPLRQCLAALEEDGYTGFCSLEYEASRVCPELEGVPRALAYFTETRALHRVLYPTPAAR